MFGLDKKEETLLHSLNTPIRIQDFLDTLSINFERDGETYMSPRRVLATRSAHCFEGALLAASALWMQGEVPLLLDFATNAHDTDHVVALYKRNGYWGAISKTNHAVLRFRDPVYKTIRELALSYFHEYYLATTGEKTLISYSRPFNLKKFGESWVTAEHDLWDIMHAIDESPHYPLVPQQNKRLIRPASLFERRITDTSEWKNKKG
jgi:hypothetical protein